MNTAKQIIISMIRSVIENKQCDISSDDADWKLVYMICQRAQITPLIYEAIEKSQYDVPEQIRNVFQQSAMYQVVLDQQQQYFIALLIEEFNKAGIDFVLLKGASLKQIYPSTLFRTMSDIDILIKDEQYPLIQEKMLSLSFEEKLESDHEYIWFYPPNIHIELHKKLIPSYNKDFFEYYGSGWRLMNNYKQHQYKLSPENELIYLLSHFAKHYRDGGIGIRHIIDIWVFRKHYPDLDEKYILQELKTLHLDKFYLNVLDTVDVWFNGQKHTLATEMITKTIFGSGSYGTAERAERSNALRLSKKHKSAFWAKICYLLSLVFPPKSMMYNKYPILEKRPYLLPVFWVRRWGEALIFKKNEIKRQSKRAKKILRKLLICIRKS